MHEHFAEPKISLIICQERRLHCFRSGLSQGSNETLLRNPGHRCEILFVCLLFPYQGYKSGSLDNLVWGFCGWELGGLFAAVDYFKPLVESCWTHTELSGSGYVF